MGLTVSGLRYVLINLPEKISKRHKIKAKKQSGEEKERQSRELHTTKDNATRFREKRALPKVPGT